MSSEIEAAIKLLTLVAKSGLFVQDGANIRLCDFSSLTWFLGDAITVRDIEFCQAQSWIKQIPVYTSIFDQFQQSKTIEGEISLVTMLGWEALITHGESAFASSAELRSFAVQHFRTLLSVVKSKDFHMTMTMAGPVIVGAEDSKDLQLGLALAYGLEQGLLKIAGASYLLKSQELQLTEKSEEPTVTTKFNSENSPDEISATTQDVSSQIVRVLVAALEPGAPGVKKGWGKEELVKYCISQEPIIAKKASLAMDLLAAWESTDLANSLLNENRDLTKYTKSLATETGVLARQTGWMSKYTLAMVVFTAFIAFCTCATTWLAFRSGDVDRRERETAKHESELADRERKVTAREVDVSKKEQAQRQKNPQTSKKSGSSNQ